MNALATDLNYPAVAAALAVMFLGAGLAIRKTHLLPQWLAWVSWLFALCGASFILGFVALLGSALWVIVVAILLAVRDVSPEGA